jgi:hypothetical protein
MKILELCPQQRRLLIVMYNYDTWVQDLTCLAYYRASTSNKLTPNAPPRA